MFVCKICNQNYKKLVGLNLHLIQKHNIDMLQYYVYYENFLIPKCNCGKNSKYIGGLKFRKTCGDKVCVNKHHTILKVNENTKIKISKSMKKLHSEGKLSGWVINKDLHKYFIKLMQMNNLFSKFTIKEKLSFGKYFLDFAFIEIKADVEIDGNIIIIKNLLNMILKEINL